MGEVLLSLSGMRVDPLSLPEMRDLPLLGVEVVHAPEVRVRQTQNLLAVVVALGVLPEWDLIQEGTEGGLLLLHRQMPVPQGAGPQADLATS